MNDANVLTQLPKVAPPIIESFRLDGVNGYKTIAVRFEHNVKIISAENGAGKTTLLNALHALLTGNAERLRKINFKSLAIKFAGQDQICTKKEELFPFSIHDVLNANGHDLIEMLVDFGISRYAASIMFELHASLQEKDFLSSDGFVRLSEIGLARHEIEALCIRWQTRAVNGFGAGVVRSHWEKAKIAFDQLCDTLRSALSGVSILYLPTFRRIETELPEYQEVHREGRMQGSDEWDENRLIFFGLQDVTRKLKVFTDDIQKGTSAAYARISGRTLDQFLNVAAPNTEISLNESDIDMLRAVLARLGKSDSEAESSMFDLIRTGTINEPKHQSLRSFLQQLLEVYQEKRQQELAVESFVNVVDSYWNHAGSEKRFLFDKEKVEVQVIDTYTKKPLPLSTLSSGEKQIVSIFARLYLNDSERYLILIDEPELSLSMEWQQKFLPDVFAAPSCAQLIAITHSPFTFDNDLDPYAGSMEISYAPKVEQ